MKKRIFCINIIIFFLFFLSLSLYGQADSFSDDNPPLVFYTDPIENTLRLGVSGEAISSSTQIPHETELLYFYPDVEVKPEEVSVPIETQKNLPVQAVQPTQPVQTPQPSTLPPQAKTQNQVQTKPNTATKDSAVQTKPTKSEEKQEKEEPLGGIWIEEVEAPSVTISTLNSSLIETKPIEASRSVSLKRGQLLEVSYPGSGWVYLGDHLAQNALVYQSRKLDQNNTIFTFKAVKETSSLLLFSRFDSLADVYQEDALSAKVTESIKEAPGTVKAPPYRTALAEEKSSKTERNSLVQEPSTTIFFDEPELSSTIKRDETSLITPTSQLEDAKKALADNNIDLALSKLDRYFAESTVNLDEAWFIRAQAYEANSALRDIKKALDSYKTIVSAYPESNRWQESNERITYINRLYFRIR